jgi:hypothetical protein
LFAPFSVAVSGANLYVADPVLNQIGEYNASTGAPINPLPVTTFNISVAGGYLFETNNNTIGKYDATTGAVVIPALISGLSNPAGIVATGVPEPSTFVLAGMGLLGLGFAALRKKYRRV